MSTVDTLHREPFVLVAVDFSAASRAALWQGAAIARAKSRHLVVMHVVSNQAVAHLAKTRQSSYERQAEIALEGGRAAMAHWLRNSGLAVKDMEVVVSVDEPVPCLLNAATGAELLVLGAVGSGDALTGAGSTSPKLVRKCAAPVLLVPAGFEQVKLDRALAAVDLSGESKVVLQAAERYCEGGREAVTALHVWHQPWEAIAYMLPLVEGSEDLRGAYIRSVEAEWEALAGEAGWPVDHVIMEEGLRPAEVIARHAAERDAPLVVVGAHGRSNLRHFLMGSTAETVLKETRTALLVVRADVEIPAGDATKA